MKRLMAAALAVGIMATGCAGSSDPDQEKSAGTSVVPAKSDSAADEKDSSGEEASGNQFFFKSAVSEAEYRGKFMFRGVVEKDVKVLVEEVAELKLGKLYELKLDSSAGSIEGIPQERLSLGHFYVMADKIYRIDPTEENIARFKETEALPDENSGVVVCQDDEMKDALAADERGWHHYITVDGDRREYHSYNNLAGTGYYESFTWEKGKGLVSYRSGYGAERDAIELQAVNNFSGQ